MTATPAPGSGQPAGAAARHAFRLEGVTAGYGRTPVLENVDLALDAGTVLGLIGPNGSGKSTLLRLLLGSLAPSSGRVEVLGAAPRQARSRIGYVPQSLAVERDLPATLRDLVLTGFVGRRFPVGSWRREEIERAESWSERLGIAHLLGRKLSALSGGQTQLGLVARALVREPELLLLDEPTANVDARAGQAMYALLGTLRQERSVVIVSHDVGVLARNVDTVACVGGGRVVYHGSGEIPPEALEEAYGCPVDLIAHGHPHRVLAGHEGSCCGGDA